MTVVWTAVYLPEASDEESKLPPRERQALANAVEKLELLGDRLGYPHSSAVRSADNLRELRPRAGRSPHRALYRIVGEHAVIAAVGPEADQDPKRWNRAVRNAVDRLTERGG